LICHAKFFILKTKRKLEILHDIATNAFYKNRKNNPRTTRKPESSICCQHSILVNFCQYSSTCHGPTQRDVRGMWTSMKHLNVETLNLLTHTRPKFVESRRTEYSVGYNVIKNSTKGLVVPPIEWSTNIHRIYSETRSKTRRRDLSSHPSSGQRYSQNLL
jgi:hypothetical protein